VGGVHPDRSSLAEGSRPGLAATDESAPRYAGLTDLESFFRLVDAAPFLNCHAKIPFSLEKRRDRRLHAQVAYVFTFSQ